MELQPTSENGKRLAKMLSDWKSKSPDFAQDTLTRVFLMYASKLENEDTFMDALYGQGVLEELQVELNPQQATEVLVKVLHAVVTSLKARLVKELVVALEWSSNDTVLSEILKLAEDSGSISITEATSALSAIDLAPQRVAMTFASMLSSARPVSEREWNISLNGQSSRVFHVCRNCSRIIIGLVNGQIKIYDSAELQCEVVLPCYNKQSAATVFRCTCTEIIAGYLDGNICVWDMKSGKLRKKISVKRAPQHGFPFGMQWENPKLVVATTDKRIQTWQYMNSAFRLLGSWNVTGIDVRPIEFDENYVVLQEIRSSSINVYYPNGQLVRKIDSIIGDTAGWAYGNGKVLTGGQDKILRIWDAQTGVCLQELEGHTDKINCVELQKGIVLTGSDSGLLTVWDVASTALSGKCGWTSENFCSWFVVTKFRSK